jgi:cobalt-zinc-cadmium efflux system protein
MSAILHTHAGHGAHDHEHDDPHRHGAAHGHLSHASKHAHRHAHGPGHGHAHGGGNERRLGIALAITAAFMLVEVGGGWISGSLALFADAGHMLADAGALAMSLFALRAAKRPPTSVFSYGHQRYEVLAAFVNGIALLALSFWILAEAVQRLITPESVHARAMLVTAVLGLLANLTSFLVLRDGEHNLNLRAAVLHVLGDVLGSAATIAAAIAIMLTNWTPIDPLLSAFVAMLILRSAWNVTRHSAHVLLEGAPAGFDVKGVAMDLTAAVPAVSGVHHVHVWSLTGDKPMVTLHAVLRDGADRELTLRAIHLRLHERFGVEHATVQIEQSGCADSGHSPSGCGADHAHDGHSH